MSTTGEKTSKRGKGAVSKIKNKPLLSVLGPMTRGEDTLRERVSKSNEWSAEKEMLRGRKKSEVASSLTCSGVRTQF